MNIKRLFNNFFSFVTTFKVNSHNDPSINFLLLSFSITNEQRAYSRDDGTVPNSLSLKIDNQVHLQPKFLLFKKNDISIML
ncbi:hypothetical protein G3A_14115 [Bacillus sp. 17376]|nr:hypothetical protein G3A_14115 [Bacillus sp. 17376]